MNFFNERSIYSCCSDYLLLDWSKMECPGLIVNWSDFNFWFTGLCIIFNPIFWNVVARWEHRTRSLSGFFRSAKLACFILGVTIILLGLFRDWRFYATLSSQPRWIPMQNNYVLWSGHLLVTTGTILVLSSFWKLGFFGTFLGDYFGILMPAKVTSFPFSLMNNPMYRGSTLNFLGTSLVHASQAGIILSVLVGISYAVATCFEGPFTSAIYSQSAKKQSWRHLTRKTELNHHKSWLPSSSNRWLDRSKVETSTVSPVESLNQRTILSRSSSKFSQWC